MELFSSVERSLSRGKRDRDLESVQILSERLRQKQTEETGNTEMLMKLESQRLELHQAN